MRTHRITYTLNSAEAADWYEAEILQVEFCDLTHWFCGLDYAGEDTPDTCIIYRGVVHPEVIYVEVEESAIDHDKDGNTTIMGLRVCPKSYNVNGKEYTVMNIVVSELDSYVALKKARNMALDIWPNKHKLS